MIRKAAVAFLILSLLGCSRSHSITVGSKNFTEQIVLGEIVAQQIERRLHVKVDRKLSLGGTLVAQKAIESGEIDLFPEYTGTALTAVLKMKPSSDPYDVLARVRAEYRKRWNVEWLNPLGFENTFALVVRGPDARSQHLETLSDAARRISQAMERGVAQSSGFRKYLRLGCSRSRCALPAPGNLKRCRAP